MGAKEACGVVGAFSRKGTDVVPKILKGLEALQQKFQAAVREQFLSAWNRPAGCHKKQPLHGPALQGAEFVTLAEQVFAEAG